METLAALEAWGPVAALRASRVAYPVVNALHITGIALLFGAILPLDLRLMGLWRGVALADLSRVLVPVAAAGFGLAVATGAMLFAVSARDYAGNPAFLAKLALVALGAANALALRRTGWKMIGGAVSALVWLAAIGAGRAIAFL